MSVNDFMCKWKSELASNVRFKTASFCGMPDPVALKQALDSHDMIVILVYRTFGISVRKAKWRKDRTSYMDQYWRRVQVKVGDIDKNRIQVFCLPITNVWQAPAVLESLVNGRFKNYSVSATPNPEACQLVEYEVEFWNPPAGFNRGLSPVNNEYTALMQAEDAEQAANFDKGFVFNAEQYELQKTDDLVYLDILNSMTEQQLKD